MVFINAPEADMLTVSKSNIINRRAVLGFAPEIGLNVVNYAQDARIDKFYLECQDLRDYYRDTYAKVHKPMSFQKHYGTCVTAVDRNMELLRLPARYQTEQQPVVLPNWHPRTFAMDYQLGGYHSGYSCHQYKR